MNLNQSRRFDTWLLIILIVAMCGQIDPFTLGRDTFVTEGYVTKQLKIALCDLVLAGAFVWFIIRTSKLRAWKRLWWPPLPCWALLFAALLSLAHSPRVLDALASFVHPSAEMGAGGRGKLLQAPKESVAEIVQLAGYFLVAPWLFVNLLHDKREREFVSRRSFALRAFGFGVGLNLLIGFMQLGLEGVPRGLWSSPNLYGGFLAMAAPLLWARAISSEVVKLKFARARPRGLMFGMAGLLGALFTMATPFAAVALGFGAILASALRASARGMALALIAMLFVAWSWRGVASDKLLEARKPHLAWMERADKAPYEMEVRKPWIEWFAAQGWSKPGDATFATGVGPGNYQLNVGQYYEFLPNKRKMPPDSNNFFLVQAVSIGVFGLAALLWVLGHFASLARRAAELNKSDWLGAGVYASLAAWLVVSLFHAMLVRGMGLVFAFLLALAVVATQSAENEEA